MGCLGLFILLVLNFDSSSLLKHSFIEPPLMVKFFLPLLSLTNVFVEKTLDCANVGVILILERLLERREILSKTLVLLLE